MWQGHACAPVVHDVVFGLVVVDGVRPILRVT